jgi:hypothetical protein
MNKDLSTFFNSSEYSVGFSLRPPRSTFDEFDVRNGLYGIVVSSASMVNETKTRQQNNCCYRVHNSLLCSAQTGKGRHSVVAVVGVTPVGFGKSVASGFQPESRQGGSRDQRGRSFKE